MVPEKITLKLRSAKFESGKLSHSTFSSGDEVGDGTGKLTGMND